MHRLGVVCFLASLLGCQPTASSEAITPASTQADARARALEWSAAKAERWRDKADDEAARHALWAEVAADIAAQTDPERRAWMLTAQFSVGRGEPGTALTRVDVAEAALAELGLDDHRWTITPFALATAVYETGRWAELRPELDARIATQHPEVAAYLAFEVYAEATGNGEWDRAKAIWSRWLARPELASTAFGPMMHAYGPERRLAPGKLLPEVCIEQLEGGPLCTADLEGFTVIDLWSIGCKGCRKIIPVLRDAQAALQAADPAHAPRFLSIDPHDDPEAIREFQRETPMPWTNAWVPEAEREAFEAALELKTIPFLMIVGPDGRILDSSPALQADAVEARVRFFQAQQAGDQVPATTR